LRFVETRAFQKKIDQLLEPEEFRDFQNELIANPEKGRIILGTGGVRKVRYAHPARGKGKRGGIRVMYYLQVQEDTIYFLLAFDKDEQDDLTPQQQKQLVAYVKENLK
jgi:mRNA-degrading endonuclease RelE of RelBE toxin-antitoxin system